MLLSLSTIGVYLSVILLYFNARKNLSTIYLSFFFFLISLYGFFQYVLLYSKSVFLVSIILANIMNVGFLFYLIGPMLYWYVRSVLSDYYRLKKKDIWHLLPMIVFLIAALYQMFTPYYDRVEIAKAIVKDAGFLGTSNLTFLSEIFSIDALFMSRPILVLGYTLWSIGLFIHYLRRRGGKSVLSRQYFMTRWLLVLLGFQLILVVSHILLLIKALIGDHSYVFYTLNVLQILSAIGLTGLLISPFFFPNILYGLPRLPALILTSEPAETETDPLPGKTKTHTPNFEYNYILSINEKADSCMKELQPYLHPDFNLTQFSSLIHIPVHHLAYYFREEKKQHFNDYKNEWRINHAKKLIKEGKASGMTLEAIGLISGFSNRNSFCTTFKKVEGISPSSFAAQIKE